MFLFGYLLGSRKRKPKQYHPEGRQPVEWLVEIVAFIIVLILLFG